MVGANAETSLTDGPLLTEDNEELARDYERVSASHQFRSGKLLVQELAIAPGERVLDVGCGTGLLAEHIADLVGPSGAVLGVDPLPLRIALAQAKARPNLRFKVADAYDLSSFRPPLSTSCASMPCSIGCRKSPDRSASLPAS
jgi:ubiquinone/menaquinone biosynthesis C-methylase UbiE